MRSSFSVATSVTFLMSLIAGPAATQAQTPTPTTPIQHVVVIFGENESFDHYFGTYPKAVNPPGQPRFTALPGTPSANNYETNPTLLTDNPNLNPANGRARPIRSGSIAARPSLPARVTVTRRNRIRSISATWICSRRKRARPALRAACRC